MPAPSLCFPSLLSLVSSHLWPLSQKIQSERFYQIIKINLWPISVCRGIGFQDTVNGYRLKLLAKLKKNSEIVSGFRPLTVPMAVNMGRLPL